MSKPVDCTFLFPTGEQLVILASGCVCRYLARCDFPASIVMCRSHQEAGALVAEWRAGLSDEDFDKLAAKYSSDIVNLRDFS